MVRISISILICLLFFSCNRVVKEENYSSGTYVNYPGSTLYPFEMDSLFVPVTLDSLNVTDFISYAGKQPLSEKFVHYVETKDYERMEIDTSRINYKNLSYFACGRLNLKHNVTGYLVLRKQPNEMSRDWSYILFILNVKNNHLTSMVVASNNNLDCPELIDNKTYINFSDYSFLITDKSYQCGIDGGFPGQDDFWSRIGLLKPKKLKYYYTSFTLDENGFVKPIPLDEDKFPEYLK